MREFKNIGDFTQHLRRVVNTIPEAGHAAMEVAAGLVLAEQKRIIGTYQRENLPDGVEPWDELKDSTKADRAREGYDPNKPGLVKGDMRDSYHKKVSAPGEIVEAACGSDSQIAEWFEEGNDGRGERVQRPRSVSQVAGFRMEKAVVATLVNGFVRHLEGNPKLEPLSELDAAFVAKMQEQD